MGARETDRRPRRENCSESPTRILGQTEETRSRRCNGLSLSLSLSLSLLSIVPSRFATRLATRPRQHTLVFPIFFSNRRDSPLPQSAVRRLSRSSAADRERGRGRDAWSCERAGRDLPNHSANLLTREFHPDRTHDRSANFFTSFFLFFFFF